MISDAYVTVTCDECGESEEIALTALASRGEYDMRNVPGELEREGWLTYGDRHVCVSCAEEPDEED